MWYSMDSFFGFLVTVEYLGFLVRGFWFRVIGSGLLGHVTQNTPEDTYGNMETSNSEMLEMS